MVKRFFYLQFIANLLMMFDMGILPACTVIMMEELKMPNSTFGMLGSMVYVGQVVGSFLAAFFLQTRNTKLVLCLCVILNVIFLLMFTFANQTWLMVLCRVLTGLFQVFLWIYLPVWADLFGNEQ